MDHVCAIDPAFQVNVIKSLYFDTPRFDLLRQKEASEFLKRKVRIRWYVDPRTGDPGSDAWLEIKSKRGARGHKRRLRLPVGAGRFDHDPVAALKHLDQEIDPASEPMGFLRGLSPAFVVQYRRRRYIEMSEGFRVALDSEIRATSVNRALLRRRRVSRPAFAVLELKGAGARTLPDSLSMLRRWGVRKASLSKYAACLDPDQERETDPDE